MGDLILSTAFLENLPPGVGVDWVVNDKFAFILEGHPRIRKLYLYRKETGLGGWIKLMRELARSHYDARVDLHVTLRSFVARVIFFFAGKPMRRISKQRLRGAAYFLFKRLVPRALRPTPYWKRFSEMGLRTTRKLGIPAPVSDHGTLHPPRYPLDVEPEEAAGVLAEYQLEPKKFIAVMPASRWKSKEWGAERYLRALQVVRMSNPTLAEFPILVMGREADKASRDLLDLLKNNRIRSRSCLTEEEFRITGFLLQQSLVYFGGDTGLAHLAEAVGTPAVMVFGPTLPDVGFGPWRGQSRAIKTSVLCAPCSKDGRPCYRVGQPYECFKRITPETAASELAKALQGYPGVIKPAEVKR